MHKIADMFIATLLGAFLGLGFCHIAVAKTPVAMVATSPDKSVVISLLDQPCDGVVATMVQADTLTKMKTAVISIQGNKLEGCWMLLPGGVKVGIIAEDGSVGTIPAELFEPRESI